MFNNEHMALFTYVKLKNECVFTCEKLQHLGRNTSRRQCIPTPSFQSSSLSFPLAYTMNSFSCIMSVSVLELMVCGGWRGWWGFQSVCSSLAPHIPTPHPGSAECVWWACLGMSQALLKVGVLRGTFALAIHILWRGHTVSTVSGPGATARGQYVTRDTLFSCLCQTEHSYLQICAKPGQN